MRYRHAVGMGLGTEKAANLNGHTKLPVEQGAYNAAIGSDDIMNCLTCHQAHGSSAAMSDSSIVGPSQNADNRSALLRLANRGVCQDCHQK
jgi:mono/diheme cytochrome c family protein